VQQWVFDSGVASLSGKAPVGLTAKGRVRSLMVSIPDDYASNAYSFAWDKWDPTLAEVCTVWFKRGGKDVVAFIDSLEDQLTGRAKVRRKTVAPRPSAPSPSSPRTTLGTSSDPSPAPSPGASTPCADNPTDRVDKGLGSPTPPSRTPSRTPPRAPSRVPSCAPSPSRLPDLTDDMLAELDVELDGDDVAATPADSPVQAKAQAKTRAEPQEQAAQEIHVARPWRIDTATVRNAFKSTTGAPASMDYVMVLDSFLTTPVGLKIDDMDVVVAPVRRSEVAVGWDMVQLDLRRQRIMFRGTDASDSDCMRSMDVIVDWAQSEFSRVHSKSVCMERWPRSCIDERAIHRV
jgi:hypothetical protein